MVGLKHRRWAVIFCSVTQSDLRLPGGEVAAGWFGTGQVEWTPSVVSEIQPALPSGVCVGECNLEKQDPEHLGLFVILLGCRAHCSNCASSQAFGKALGAFRALLQSSCRAAFLYLSIFKNYLHASIMEVGI